MNIPKNIDLCKKILKSLDYSDEVEKFLPYDEILKISREFYNKFQNFSGSNEDYMELMQLWKTDFIEKHSKTLFINKEAYNLYSEIPLDILYDTNKYTNTDIFKDLTSTLNKVSLYYEIEESNEKPLLLITYLEEMTKFYSTFQTKDALKKELTDFYNKNFSGIRSNKLLIDGESAFEPALYAFYAISEIPPNENIKYITKFLKKNFAKTDLLHIFNKKATRFTSENTLAQHILKDI